MKPYGLRPSDGEKSKRTKNGRAHIRKYIFELAKSVVINILKKTKYSPSVNSFRIIQVKRLENFISFIENDYDLLFNVEDYSYPTEYKSPQIYLSKDSESYTIWFEEKNVIITKSIPNFRSVVLDKDKIVELLPESVYFINLL